MENYTIYYTFNDVNLEKEFTGPVDQNINLINMTLKCDFVHINNQIISNSEISSLNKSVLEALLQIFNDLYSNRYHLTSRELSQILRKLSSYQAEEEVKSSIDMIVDFYLHKPIILTTHEGTKITPATLAQKQYYDLLEESKIVFVTGSAGSGKTYLAVAYAVSELKKNHIKKLIITRPVVEAGEKLGFLPGDLKEKVDPYLVPIYDALNDFLGVETVLKLQEKGTIEIAPLAYMRGRTLDHAMIILDEAQNTTPKQMKMFLTRLGFDSKMVITGDLTQVDLSNAEKSGLLDASSRLKGVPQISHLKFSKEDCMRHPLVTQILERYGDE